MTPGLKYLLIFLSGSSKVHISSRNRKLRIYYKLVSATAFFLVFCYTRTMHAIELDKFRYPPFEIDTSHTLLLCSKRGFTTVLNVQESIFVFLFFIDSTHESSVWRNGIGAKQKEGLFGSQLDALANNIMELADSQVGWNQVLLFVNIRNIGTIRLFANHRHSIGILGTDTFCFRFALFYRTRE